MDFKVLAFIAQQIKGITLEEFSSRFSSFYKTKKIGKATYTFFDKDFVGDLSALSIHSETCASGKLAIGFEELNQFDEVIVSISFKL
jgi:hypothetical protein